jgi:cytochrome bd-type quinol oxidase subunit 1
MSGQRAKLSLGQVLLVSLGCGLVVVLLLFAGQLATGNQEANWIPILKTAAVMGLFTTLGAAYICLKHFWDRSK